MSKSTQQYSNYEQVPFYRRQWFFWIMLLILQPVALAILIFGDVYYTKKGKVVSFGIANRIVAGIFAAGIIYQVYMAFFQ